MKKKLISIALLAVLLCLLAAPALAATYARITGGWLRLRSNPSYDAKVITSYKSGTIVTILSQENGWARVLTPDYRIGYMDARYLVSSTTPVVTPVPTQQPPSRTWTTVNQTAYVTSANGRGVRLRSSPEVTSSNVLGLYPVGRTVMELRRSSDGWSYIRIDKKHGYMMTQYLATGVAPYYPPTNPPTWGPVPVITATPSPAPAPQTVDIQSVKLSPYQPTAGDTISVIVTPSNAEFTAVWYSDQNILLSTSKSYTVKDSDVGHVINVRVMGVGASAGFVTNAYTATVKAASAPASEPEISEGWVDTDIPMVLP